MKSAAPFKGTFNRSAIPVPNATRPKARREFESAVAGANDFTVTVHNDLPSHWPSGADAEGSAFHIFQSREFIRSWEESFGTDDRYTPFYVDVQNADGNPLMLVPLCIDTQGGTRKLTFIDQGHADYNSPVLFPPSKPWTKEAFQSVWARILDSLPPFDVASLEKMPDQVFDQFNPFSFLFQEKNEESCHGIDLVKSMQEIEATQPGVKNLKRKYRNLEKLDVVELHVVTNSTDAKRFIDKLVIQKQRRYEETMVPGFENSPHALKFLWVATDHLGKSGNLQVFALQVGDEIVAVNWGLSRMHHIYSLVTGFEDGVWRKYSCGKVLVLRMLQWLQGGRFDYLDHGYGDEEYKVASCDKTVELYQAELAYSLKGRLYSRRRLIMKWMRSTYLWQTLRPLKWKLLRRG